MRTHVYLIPGFFGFANLGELKYFAHCKEPIERAFAEARLDVDVHQVQTLPTSSIHKRTERLLDVIRDTAGDEGPIALVGHSTGALDARLLVSPKTSLVHAEPVASRVTHVVSVSGAHQGTPLASFFRAGFGKPLLKLLSLFTIHTLRLGPVPVRVIANIGALLSQVDDAVGVRPDIVNQVVDELLQDFTPERRRSLAEFFTSIGEDQALLDELSPDGARHFDVHTTNRPGVKYGCVVNEARKPGVSSTLAAGLSPYAQASHALYHAIYRITARATFDVLPHEAVLERERLKKALGDLPDATSNDGIVPTLSQFHGELIRAVRADHHDVIGHFDQPQADPPHIDWLLSGTHFDASQFRLVWTDIAHFLLA